MKIYSEAESSFFLVAYLFLNLSIRPAVSTSLTFPVKNGWLSFEISNLIKGYSLPSSHFKVSLVFAVLLPNQALSNEISLNITVR